MSFAWMRWFQPNLPEDMARRVSRWAALPPADLNIPLDTAKMAVIDLETTGLSPASDAILSVGAVMLQSGALSLGASFHCYVTPERQSSRENVLVHGIAPSQQARGVPPRTCLLDFLEFCGTEPLVAFHAPFDQAFLARAVRRWLGVRFRNPFLDAAWMLPALFPKVLSARASLDEWAQHFRLHNPRRHAADSDAFTTAELALVALAEAHRRRIPSVRALSALVRHTAQLAPSGSSGSV
jgi:DNA polymerase III subunit epsilon